MPMMHKSCDPTLSRQPWSLGTRRRFLWNASPSRGAALWCPGRLPRANGAPHAQEAQLVNAFHSINARRECVHGTNSTHSKLTVSSDAYKPPENETLRYPHERL